MLACSSSASRDGSRTIGRLLAAGVLAAIVAVLPFTTAHAHVDFEASVPADGDVVDVPVATVTITFSGEATPVGDGFVALTPSGELQAPAGVTTDDQQVYVLTFDPPLGGGEVGLRWEVAAPDSHPIAGAFAFTVTAPAVTTLPPTTVATTNPPTTVADAAPPSTQPASASVGTETGGAPPPTPAVAEPVAESAPAITLDEFLDVDAARPGEGTTQVGRAISFPAALVSIGLAVFLATAFRGSGAELRTILAAAAGLGVALAAGSLVEYAGVARTLDESLGATWTTGGGGAAAARFGAGVLIAVGAWLSRGSVAVTRSLSAASSTGREDRRDRSRTSSRLAVVEPGREDRRDRSRTSSRLEVERRERWVPDRSAWLVVLGGVLVVVSFWLDGHTASRGPQVVHAAVNAVHVLAGSVWVGGVVGIAWLAWRRRGSRGAVSGVFLRFSRIATVALVGVVVAGVVMAVFVLDSPGDLTGTEWGRTLLVKLVVVGAAIACGAYNHFALLPRIESRDDAPHVDLRVRRSLTVEATALVLVGVVTSVLVAATT